MSGRWAGRRHRKRWEQPRGKPKNALRHYRDEFDDALDRLIGVGTVEVVERVSENGKTTAYVRVVGERNDSRKGGRR